MSGYADDTAFYLRDHSLIKYVLSILDELAGVSGLTTNMSKSMVLRLHSRGLDLPLDTRGITLLTPEASCRYLGVMVGQLDTIDENWTKCI